MLKEVVAVVVAILLSLDVLGSNAAAAENSPIMDVVELKRLQGDSVASATLLLFDVRTRDQYEAGHILGAQHIDTAMLKKAAASDAALADLKAWEELLTGLGISQDSVVVVYGEPLPESARAWWLFRYAGVRARLLDGGIKAWTNSGGALSNKAVALTKPTHRFEVHFQPERLATSEELKRIGVEQKTCQIVDNRTTGEFTGKEVRGARGGHIPSAKHLDWMQLVDREGKFLPVDRLKEILSDAGVDLDKPIATHCQSGGRSSVGAIVMELVTGRPAKNYYGSWAQWSADKDLPIE